MEQSPISTRVASYVADWQLSIDETVGRGNDGEVWFSTSQTVIKAFYREETYQRERDCYRRLKDQDVRVVAGFTVPQLLNYDNRRLIIEMTPVFPPCVLDFGKAYVDEPPDYSPEVLAETEAAERELFEPHQWKDVLRVRAGLRAVGIYYFDARPSNIMFPP